MKNITEFINEGKMYASFEDYIKSLKLKYTKELRNSKETPCPLCDECESWEEYILDDFDTITSFVYCNKVNEFALCIDSLFADIKEFYVDEDVVTYSFPQDTNLFTKSKINKCVKNYENGND